MFFRTTYSGDTTCLRGAGRGIVEGERGWSDSHLFTLLQFPSPPQKGGVPRKRPEENRFHLDLARNLPTYQLFWATRRRLLVRAQAWWSGAHPKVSGPSDPSCPQRLHHREDVLFLLLLLCTPTPTPCARLRERARSHANIEKSALVSWGHNFFW